MLGGFARQDLWCRRCRDCSGIHCSSSGLLCPLLDCSLTNRGELFGAALRDLRAAPCALKEERKDATNKGIVKDEPHANQHRNPGGESTNGCKHLGRPCAGHLPNESAMTRCENLNDCLQRHSADEPEG
jgi:hypothetical protein